MNNNKPQILSFGKYKFKTTEEVYNTEPTYLAWAKSNGLVCTDVWVKMSIEAKHDQDLEDLAYSLGPLCQN